MATKQPTTTQPTLLPRSARGAPEIEISQADGQWLIAGKKHRVFLNESDLRISVETGPLTWRMGPSTAEDMLVQWRDERFYLRLTDAERATIEPYDTGYKTGVKIRLEGFRSSGLFSQGLELDLTVVLTVCLEGDDEELICDAVAIEREAALRQLDWPKAIDASEADYAVLNHVSGNLLPRDWPHDYHPFRNFTEEQETDITYDEVSEIHSHLIETWSMSWWGFVREASAMMLIVETPDDASYEFSHPAGGPTVIGLRWLASLGRFRTPRSVRFVFFDEGNYVTLAKRYRKYVQDSGHFVSLREKIAHNPLVAKLVGASHLRQYALLPGESLEALPVLQQKPAASTYDPDDPDKHYGLRTFDELAEDLRTLKAQGFERIHATMCAWPQFGYNRQHPDPLPPAAPAGGWEGLRRWAETCEELGYTSDLHDQYRDYYYDAPSFDPQFAIHEDNASSTTTTFPGARFFGWKDGYIPVMDFWIGWKQAFLSARFAPGHLKKNYELLAKRGIRPTGIYIDVFGYVPPNEDFNPEHPLTRGESMAFRALCFNWARNNLGIVGAEAGADWTVPYVDYASGGNAGACIPVPLFNLVYHDAVMTPAGGLEDPLRCLLNGGYPELGQTGGEPLDIDMAQTILALHKRIALLEMTNHEFLDEHSRVERSTFADGTTITIDKDALSFEIDPPLALSNAD
jgi:hypothetical protein